MSTVIIAVNQTVIDIVLPQISAVVPASGQVVLTEHVPPDEILSDEDLAVEVNNGNITLIVNGVSLTIEQSKSFLNPVNDIFVKHNWDALRDPLSTDDESDGYSKGSRWFNQSTSQEWICLNASVNNANWAGVVTTIGASTQGSTLYYDGYSWVELAPGNDGYLFTAHGNSGPTWEPISELDVIQDSGEWTGFINRSDSEISFDELTRIFTIEPSVSTYNYYTTGVKIIKSSSDSVVIPDVTNNYYIYFNGATLNVTTTFFDGLILGPEVYVASVYWNATESKGILIGDERHGLVMDGITHQYLHNTFGARYQGGLALNNFVTDGNGSSDTHAQIALSDGIIWDEDLRFYIQDGYQEFTSGYQELTPIAEIPMLYLDGTGIWKRDISTQFPLKQGTLRIQYNNFNLGVWTTVDAGQGDFVAVFLIATNDISESILGVLGQRRDGNINDARDNNIFENLVTSNFPTKESKPIWRLIFETRSTFTNSVNARLVDVLDLRNAGISPGGNFSTFDHNSLSGRADANSHPAIAISTDTTLFNELLSATDDTVQKALDTLDDILTSSAPADVDKSAAVVGIDTTAARSDHKHNISTATAVSTGATNAEGTSTSLARADHTHSVTDLNISGQEQGSILYFSGSNWLHLAPSDDGYVLTTHDTGSDPNWDVVPFGSSFEYSENLTRATTTSGTPVVRVSITVPPGINGDYIVFISCRYDCNNKKGRFDLYNLTDAVVLCDYYFNTNNVDYFWPINGFAKVTLTGTSKTFQLRWYDGENKGETIGISNARIMGWRVS